MRPTGRTRPTSTPSSPSTAPFMPTFARRGGNLTTVRWPPPSNELMPNGVISGRAASTAPRPTPTPRTGPSCRARRLRPFVAVLTPPQGPGAAWVATASRCAASGRRYSPHAPSRARAGDWVAPRPRAELTVWRASGPRATKRRAPFHRRVRPPRRTPRVVRTVAPLLRVGEREVQAHGRPRLRGARRDAGATHPGDRPSRYGRAPVTQEYPGDGAARCTSARVPKPVDARRADGDGAFGSRWGEAPAPGLMASSPTSATVKRRAGAAVEARPPRGRRGPTGAAARAVVRRGDVSAAAPTRIHRRAGGRRHALSSRAELVDRPAAPFAEGDLTEVARAVAFARDQRRRGRCHVGGGKRATRGDRARPRAACVVAHLRGRRDAAARAREYTVEAGAPGRAGRPAPLTVTRDMAGAVPAVLEIPPTSASRRATKSGRELPVRVTVRGVAPTTRPQPRAARPGRGRGAGGDRAAGRTEVPVPPGATG